LWQEGFQGLGKAPAGCLWVDVCDRGADAFEALHAALALGHHALIRACQDRCILVERDGRQEKGYLMQTARSPPGQCPGAVEGAQCRGSVEVTQKGGRPARTARVQLAACEAVVEPPRHALKSAGYKALRVWLVRVWEEAPPEGEEALEWVLLSTLPAGTEEE